MTNKIHDLNMALDSFRLLRGFEFSSHLPNSENGVNQGDLILSLMNRQGEIRRFRFSGVRNLELRTGAYIEPELVYLRIADMSTDQWKDVRLRVSSEDDLTYLFFYCVEAELIAN